MGEREVGSRESSKRGRESEKWEDVEEEFEKWKRRKKHYMEGMEGRSEEERKWKLNRIIERVLGKKERIMGIRERRGDEER